MCDTRLGDSTGLVCDNDRPHTPHHGCTFTASAAPDRHNEDTSDGEAGL